MPTGLPRTLPEGRVTFVFTDVVGSTRQFIQHGDVYAKALIDLHALIEAHAARHSGCVVETEGDGSFLAFPDAVCAAKAITGLQEELEANRYGSGLRLRIRAGAHT